MPPSSETRNYDALVTTTLGNMRQRFEDTISTSNVLLFYLMRRQSGGYASQVSLGERAEHALMYALTPARVYSGYDQLSVTPMDGITKAFYSWAQIAAPIAISRIEERQNAGEYQMLNLLRGKTKQTLLGIQDTFGRALLQGNGPNSATAITTAYTDNATGATFVVPLPLMIADDPTSSTSIGNINQNTYTWWRNLQANATDTNYASFLSDLRALRRRAGHGPGGVPNLHICDDNVANLYEAALAAQHRNPSYQRADIPFENVSFHGQPVVADEFVPDVNNGTITSIPVAASGTWFMVNTEFLQLQYDRDTNFINTPFQKPENQDAKVSHIMWYGALTCGNRRKQAVLADIDTTLTS